MSQRIRCNTPSTRRRSSSATIKMSEMSKWLLLSCVTGGKFMNIVCVLVCAIRENRKCFRKLLSTVRARPKTIFRIVNMGADGAPYRTKTNEPNTRHLNRIYIQLPESKRNPESWIMNHELTAHSAIHKNRVSLRFPLFSSHSSFLGSLLWCNASILLALRIYFFRFVSVAGPNVYDYLWVVSAVIYAILCKLKTSERWTKLIYFATR